MRTKSLGQFIAALRKANGMTQQDVAERLSTKNEAVQSEQPLNFLGY